MEEGEVRHHQGSRPRPALCLWLLLILQSLPPLLSSNTNSKGVMEEEEEEEEGDASYLCLDEGAIISPRAVLGA